MTEAQEMIEKFLDSYSKVNPSIVHNVRSNGNYSVSYSSKKGTTFAYLDIVKGSVIARLKLNSQYPTLKEFEGVYREYTGSHKIGTWKDVTEVAIENEKHFRFYIEVFEIARKVNEK
jgi:hypothetical protein